MQEYEKAGAAAVLFEDQVCLNVVDIWSVSRS